MEGRGRGRGGRERRGFRRGGGGGGRWRDGGSSGGRGRRGGQGGRGWRGNRGGGRGGQGDRGFSGGRGGPDWNDRRPAEPTVETLALMGTQAQESTVGIIRFISEDIHSFSGILKQRYSDFIVHEVGPDGEVCKGTDFPALLRPVEHTPPSNAPGASMSDRPRVEDTGSTRPADENRGDSEKGNMRITVEGSTNGNGGVNDQEEEQGNDVGEDEGKGAVGDSDSEGKHQLEKKEATDIDREKDRENDKREEEEREKVNELVKVGVQTLLPVLGEEVTAKVEAFVLEGVLTKGRDKRTLTLPSTDKATRTQVYKLLKQHLSRFVLAVTVDEAYCATRATAEKPGVSEVDGANDAGSSKDGGGGGEVTTVCSEAENGGAVATSGDGPGNNCEEDASKAITEDAKSGGNINNAVETSQTGSKPDPNAPKGVQLRMKPDWRGTGSTKGKRRRGDLAAGAGNGGRWGWPADRPEFCRFVLYKENIDTMGAINRMCKHLRFSSKLVGYAGTKDKRGCTSQWCTAKKKSIEELRAFNRPLGTFQGPIALLGNFSYVGQPLKLGNLSGNRFGIVLRNVNLPGFPAPGGEGESVNRAQSGPGDQAAGSRAAPDDQVAIGEDNGMSDNVGDADAEAEAVNAEAARTEAEVVAAAGARLKKTIDHRCARVKERGFINYFGLQRFGTGGAPTSEVGLAMLKEDWEGAVRLVMTPRIGENEATHASKVHYLKNPTDIEGTLNKLPFFMHAEKSMMQVLLRGGANAHVDALKAVPKNLQLMYLHAFQSLLWNLAASERIELYGREGVVEGDLVFPRDSTVSIDSSVADPEAGPFDSEGSALLNHEGGADDDDEATESRDVEDQDAKRPRKTPARLPDVHMVTNEDVKKRTFRLTDVVLPMPGFGVTYPTNRVKDCYTRALKERGLTEACFSSSSQKVFSLGGMYRRLIQMPKDMTWEMKLYDNHTLHLINTDIDDLLDIEDAKIAVEKAEKERQGMDGTGETNPPHDGVDSTGTLRSRSPQTTVSAVSAAVESGSESTEEKAVSTSTMDVETTNETKGSGLKLAGSSGRYTALCLKFTLPSASYATMCIREITKQDTGTSFQSSLNPPGSTQQPSMAIYSGDSQGTGLAGGNNGGTAAAASPGVARASPSKGAVIKIGASFRA